MKKIFSLLALVLFINLFTYQAQAQTAVVNINKTSVSLKELIHEVEKQAGYLFVYGKDINIEQKVKINARNKQVKALLENVLPQIGLTYEYADNYISLKKTQVEKKSIGKKIIVKGTVVDKSGEPIIGANIMEQGSAVNAPGLAAMVIKDGVDFESLDDEPVKILFLIAAPDTKDNVHLDVLSKLSVLLMDEDFVAKLMKAGSPEEFIEIIDGADEEAKSIDERLEKEDDKPAKILAVTSCPTGIAHTYMAAEGLEKAAAKAGCAIKIETRGSGGAKNVLTDADIESAECIIVAADAQVPMERFDGKKVIECQVSDGINKADELIKKALAGDAPVYKAGTSEKKESTSAKKGGGIGHKIYTQLMNGVSHMLPFVVGGGILIAIAFLIDGLNVDMNALSEAERSNFGTITPVAALFKSIGGAAFGFMLPVLAGFIAMAIGDRPALALGFVGGYIAANGKSGFLGALVAGFAAGYIIVLLRKICDKLPEALEKIAPVLIYPVVGILVIGLGMTFIVEPVMGGINTGLNSFLAGMGSTSRVL